MGNHATLDIGPVMVKGAIRARHARVVWHEGTVYVLSRRAGKIERQTVAASEPTPPDHPNGFWRSITDEGQSLSWTARGCGG